MSVKTQWRKYTVVTLLIYLNGAWLFAASEERIDKETGFSSRKPFSAMLVEYNRSNPGVISETRVLVSQQGVRSETKTNRFDNVKIILIINYLNGRAWLIDPFRQVYSELIRGNQIDNHTVANRDRTLPLGVLANEPCAGLLGSKRSTTTVVGTELSLWHCVDEQGYRYLQHYSAMLGVVVRQESQDGWIKELRDIEFVENSLHYLKPSADYKEISINELFTGSRALADYIE